VHPARDAGDQLDQLVGAVARAAVDPHRAGREALARVRQARAVDEVALRGVADRQARPIADDAELRTAGEQEDGSRDQTTHERRS